MDGNKVGKYGDFHMLPSIVKYDRTHPVQLTASNLALPLKMSPRKKEGKSPDTGCNGLGNYWKHESLSRSARPGHPERPEREKKALGQDG